MQGTLEKCEQVKKKMAQMDVGARSCEEGCTGIGSHVALIFTPTVG